MTIKLTSSTLLTLLTTTLLTACSGDDGKEDPIDAAGLPDCGCSDVPDAAVDAGAPDALEGDRFLLPEGGEIRLERCQLGPDDDNAELAAHALFFKGQEPATRSFKGVEIALRQELQNQGYVCADLRDGANFDNGPPPQAVSIVDTREYYDIGASATLINADDGTDVIMLDKYLGSEDPAGALDLASYLVHDILYKAPGTTPVKRNARYLPTIAGSADYPMLDVLFGETATGDELTGPDGLGTPQIFVPAAFTMISPAEADFFTSGTLVLTKGEDFVLTYDLPETEPADWPTVVPFIDFMTPTDLVQVRCLKITPGLPEDGSFTVPHEAIEILQGGPGSYGLFGRMVHAAWETRQDQTRLDFVGIESKIFRGYVVQDAPPASK